MRGLLLAVLLVGCSATPSRAWMTGHATSPFGGHEAHSCRGPAGGFDCWEGYACTPHGCEWCGPGETRCTGGND